MYEKTASIWKIGLVLSAIVLIFLIGTVSARAGAVKPSGEKDNTDRAAIMRELESSGRVTLQKGGTYYLSASIHVNSGNTIDARGATIISAGSVVRNDPNNYKTDYSSMKNVRIIGGKWLSAKKNGQRGTSFSFAHSTGITLQDMEIACANAEGHAIELVACKNVTVKKCKIIAQGKGKADSNEEMVQIDVASPATAPFLKNRKLQNGLTCSNIKIIGNTVVGNRAVCANYTKTIASYTKKYHRNIVIKNNHLTGNTAEALALFNTIDATVTGNTLKTVSKRVNEAYSIGCHVALFGTIDAFKKGSVTVKNNKIYGGRQAFQLCSHTKSRYGKLVIQNNRLYCKKGKNNALKVTVNAANQSSAIKVSQKKNKCNNWK